METADDSLQPTIDMLLNISVFAWYGAICPWGLFGSNNVLPLYRLVILGILILLFRRIPMVFAFHKKIPEIEQFHQAAFVGYFGPIGVSAIFYLYVSVDFLRQVQVDGKMREDAVRLEEVMRVVIWFLAICSIVAHGLSIPLGKMGYNTGRTMSQALSHEREDVQDSTGLRPGNGSRGYQIRRRRIHGNQNLEQPPRAEVFRIGRPTVAATAPQHPGIEASSSQEPNRPVRFIESEPPTGSQTPVEEGVTDTMNQGGGKGNKATLSVG